MSFITKIERTPRRVLTDSGEAKAERGPGLALAIALAGLLLGLAGDLLLNAPQLGINMPLWLGALVLAGTVVSRRRGVALTGGGRWLVLPALLFAACLAWRASPALAALNVLAMLGALALAAFRARRGRLRDAGLLEYGFGLFWTGVHGFFGPFIFALFELPWRGIPALGRLRAGGAVLRGLLLALPLLLIFGALFASADAVFEGLVSDLFRWNLDDLFSHLFWVGFWGWASIALLRQTLVSANELPLLGVRPGVLTLGRIETGMVLGALNGLFLLFVAVQIRYLFGGAQVVLDSQSLTYAEYARRGFFELVTVATLLLPLLLVAHWAQRHEDAGQERLFRILAGLLVALMFVIMASALQRMRLYQEAFGLTELRLYTTAFMGWLALVFLWFLATVLRGRRAQFSYGALGAAFAVLLLLNALNPDLLILRTNLARDGVAEQFDARYAADLGGDAIPLLIEALPQLPEEERCYVAARILVGWRSPSWAGDWRAWNWSRQRALAAVHAQRAYLEDQACAIR